MEGTESMRAKVTHAVRPHLRGWLHLGTFPVAVTAGTILVLLAPAGRARNSVLVFSLSAALLFGISALYHRRHWSPRVEVLLKRFDHANIFLIIAGTYTPFTVLLLPDGPAQILLLLVWGGAVAGMAFRIFWVNAPRWLYVPAYLALGWAAVAFLPEFLDHGGVAVMSLVIAGGVLYTAGGVVYGLKRPNPSPRWFGFHEVFHALTVAAFILHSVGIWLTVYSTAPTSS